MSKSLEVYLRLLNHCWPFRTIFALGILATIIGSLMDAGLAWLVKPLIDNGLTHQHYDMLMTVPALIVMFAATRGTMSYASDYWLSKTGRSVVMVMRERLFRHLLRMPHAIYDHYAAGELLSVIIYNIDQLAAAATDALLAVVRDGFMVIGLIIVMVLLSWQLSLICFFSAPIVAILMTAGSRKCRQMSQEVQRSMGVVTHISEEAIKSQREIKLYNAFDQEAGRFEEALLANRTDELRVVKANAMMGALVQLVIFSSLAAASILSCYLDAVTTGAFIAVGLAMGRLLQPIKRLSRVNVTVQKGIAAAKSVFEILDAQEEPHGGDTPLPDHVDSLEVKHLSLRYPERQSPALDDVSLSIGINQQTSLVGLSGSGKSSMMKCLLYLYPYDGGDILLNGVDIRQFNIEAYRQLFSYVGQDIRLFNQSIAYNIAYGKRFESEISVEEAAQRAHIHDFIISLPDGYETIVGDNGVKLSGGQRQRLAIARALWRNAPILVFDEATSDLDSISERSIQEAIEELHGNKTIITIAHRLNTIQASDRIYLLSAGQVVAEGNHKTLLETSSDYREMVSLQSGDNNHEGMA